MRKVLLGICSVWSVAVCAQDNNLFQEFDNQVSIGYGILQMTSGYGTTNTIPYNSWVYSKANVLNFEAERLLNSGIWIDVNSNMSFGAGPVNQNPVVGSNGKTFQLSDYGINGKVGYGFSVANQHLQIIPYALLGLNSMSDSVQYAASTPDNSANEFAYTGGAGVRLEYRINRTIMLFADQLVAYNWDQSGPVDGVMPQNTLQMTSTLGAKFNLAKNFQVGVEGIYSNYQPQASNYTAGGFMMQPQYSVGGLVSVGLTY